MRRTKLPGWRSRVHPGFYYHQGIRASIAFSVVLFIFGVIALRAFLVGFSFPTEELHSLSSYIRENRSQWFTVAVYIAIVAGMAYIIGTVLGLFKSETTYDNIESSDNIVSGILSTTATHPESPDTTSTFDLTSIEPFAFEKLIANLLEIQHQSVVEIGGKGPDGEIDLIVDRIDRSPIAVQCKKYYRHKINVDQMRSFIGSMSDGGFESGVYATLKGYTHEARAIAERHGIELWDNAYILTLIENNKDRLNEETNLILCASNPHCPGCNTPMITRRAKKGRLAGLLFWACPSRKCNCTLPYGNERETGSYL